MDGNGRWAESRGKMRTRGHQEGAKRVDEIVTESVKLGVRYLTLYTFSTENWNRPSTEVKLLMRLLVHNLKTMDKKLKKNKVRLTAQGSLDKLPKMVHKELLRVMRETSEYDPKMELCLALSYGGRGEIVEAAKRFSKMVQEGTCLPEMLDEKLFSQFLYRPHVPDPDVLIRTGGESRVSNFLLWQIAYAEMVVVADLWPDFTPEVYRKALEGFGKRRRRFGKTQKQIDDEMHSSIISGETYFKSLQPL